MNKPIMARATAVWLVDNTTLTFRQIAEFCGMHELEVQGIADGDVAAGVKGFDPVTNNQLEADEIRKAEADPTHDLKLKFNSAAVGEEKRRGPRYTPLSKRQDRPNAILWLVRNHPELKDAQISRLVGTTKSTIDQIRGRTHWNSASLQPVDPVTLGLCSQIDLDLEVSRASSGRQPAAPAGDTLLPASLTERMTVPAEKDEDAELDANAVFAKLSSLKRTEPQTDDED
jgi:hypothetical protein